MEKPAFARGLEGVIAAESAICRIDGDKGKLYYLGYSIEDLVEHGTFEEVTYLLLYGELPTRSQFDEFRQRMRNSRDLNPQILESFPIER